MTKSNPASTNPLIMRAQADHDRLVAEAQQLRDWLAEAEANIAKLASFIEMTTAYTVTGRLPGSTPYPAALASQAPKAEPLPPPLPVPKRAERLTSPRGTMDRALAECTAIFGAIGRPVRTPALLSMLLSKGIHIGGRQPVTNLSALLSRHPQFINHGGRKGWTYDASLDPNAKPADIQRMLDLMLDKSTDSKES